MKSYSLRERKGHAYEEVSEPQMMTTSVSDPAGPLMEKRL